MRYESPRQGDVVAAPVCIWLKHEDGVLEGFEGRSWDQVDNRADRTARSTSITSILAELWSRIRRRREIHRIKAAWGMIDDRTLDDIGVSRYQIEYARDAGDRR